MIPMGTMLYALFEEIISFINSGYKLKSLSLQDYLDLISINTTIVYCSIRIAHPFGAYLDPELLQD